MWLDMCTSRRVSNSVRDIQESMYYSDTSHTAPRSGFNLSSPHLLPANSVTVREKKKKHTTNLIKQTIVDVDLSSQIFHRIQDFFIFVPSDSLRNHQKNFAIREKSTEFA